MGGNSVTALLLVLLLVIPSSLALTSEERNEIRACQSDSRDDYRTDRRTCNDDRKSCYDTCKEESVVCNENLKEELNTCTETCEATFVLTGNETRREKYDIQKELRYCTRDCKKDYNTQRRSECSISQCRRECTAEKNTCTRTARDEYKSSREKCKYMHDDIVCEGFPDVEPGTTFENGCESCSCGYDGDVDCDATTYCHYTDEQVTVDQELCESSGGLYDRPCYGTFFSFQCTREEFCLCGGLGNYTCPENHECLTEHALDINRLSQGGFRNGLGLELGHVGICASQ